MTSLYRRATPQQTLVLRMVEGAVRNVAHAHPGARVDDERIARSIAKRAAGTLTSQWGDVLAVPRARSDDGERHRIPLTVTEAGTPTILASDNWPDRLESGQRGASDMRWRAPFAAGQWFDIRRVSPLPGRSYLVATKSVGVVMDVAFFTGPRPGGGLWWTMTNAEFPSNVVTHWATLIATPKEMHETLRSGTWSTVRYARKQGKPIWIVWPDGSVSEEKPR